MFLLGCDPTSPFTLGARNPHLTKCAHEPHERTCQIASKPIKSFKQGAQLNQTVRQTMDRETVLQRNV